ncbi:WecB/TagA/CpsF family glycosyltransferase [Priestia aryabhattai]|uniref:WecB/TagA/CpsF family glycosyltransferase n=1 Tax=Priestia TaxID=2800373 RepID=UPI001F1C9FC8|nr:MULTISPECIES: WecB/TagA/CpsF family glycosyltransferase [Priestia]MED3820742.1 WecB/TagA/CpsF family glycosyltransferase [Priestia aryabhattai]
MRSSTISLFGVRFNNISLNQTINEIKGIVEKNKVEQTCSYAVTPNVDHVVNIHKDKKFAEAYTKAHLTLVDGAPIFLLSKVFRKPLVEKVSGSDLTPEILKLAQTNNYRVFIFGSMPGVAELAIQKIKSENNYNFPISSYSPEFGFEKSEEDLQKCINLINDFRPDILLVSLGSPKGEMFIFNNLDKISAPFSIQIGASIDFIAGNIKRAPAWMQKLSLEWFYRFLKEPKRMFKRYFLNDSYFLVVVIKELLKRK